MDVPPNRRGVSTATAVTLAAILLILLVGAGQIVRSREVALAAASQRARSLAAALAQHATRTIEGVDLVLTGVQERLRNPDPSGMSEYLRRRATILPQLHKLQVTNAAGDWIHDSVAPHPPLSSGDRAYFTWHRETDAPGVHIDVPIVSRFGAVTVIPVSRRLSKADGSFDGVVSATLFSDHFRSFYDSIKMGNDGAIALWLADGRLLVRDPAPSPAMARDISASRLFTQSLREASAGVMQTPSSAVDGRARIVGFQRLDRFPVVVTASITMEDALAAWRHDAIVQAAVMAIAVLALGGLGAGLERRGRRVAASERASRDTQTLFKGIFAHAADGLSVYRVDGDGTLRLEICNPAAGAAYGLDAASSRGKCPAELMGRDEAARLEAHLAEAFATGLPVRTEDHGIVGGERRIWDVIHVPLRDATSDRIGRVLVGARDITHLKTAETEARDANRLLVLAERIAHIGHWQVTFPDRALTWSDEVYRIHGLDPASFTPAVDSAIALYHPDDRAAVTGDVEQAVATGLGFGFDRRILRPDGSVRHVQTSGFFKAPAADEPGQGMLFGVITDVTDMRQVERALAEKSAVFEAALQSMDQGLLMIAPDGTVPVANGRALQLLDLPEDLMAGRPTYRAVREHLRRNGAWGESIEDSHHWYLDRDRRTADLISERRRADGSVIEIRSLPIDGGDAYVQTVTDVTERRLAESRLRDSEARYRLLADHTSDLIVLTDVAGCAGYVSPAVTQILGYGVDDVAGVGLPTLIHPDDRPRFAASLQGLVTAEASGSALFRMRHRAGHDVWIEAALRRVEEAGVTRIVMALRDVTLRQRQAAHLERAKIAAEAGARVKAEFLANMSHELRTPLTGMLGIHDLLQSDPTLNPAQRRLVGLAQESGHSLLTIVNDILDFSKMEAGQLTIETRPFGLRALIASCRDLVGQTAPDRDLRIDVDIAPATPDAVVGDSARLRQVILNLATNAIKFTPSGSVTLGVRWLTEGPRQRLRIAVTDTGIGIAADKLPHLFQRFSQADGSISRTYGGTGLGLAISRRLVELMGGDIGVASEIDVGSTFWFEVPLTLERRAPLQPPIPTDDAPSGSYRVLLAEDNPINQEVIAAVLRRKGHVVDVVGDGAEAVSACATRPDIDIVLMDVQMPGQDGLSAAAAIRAGEAADRRRRRPIIALTANAMAEEIVRCRAAGMDAHVAKPVDWPNLFSAMDRVVRETARTTAEERA